MQFIMKYATLLHIGPSQVQAPNQSNAIYQALHEVIAC